MKQALLPLCLSFVTLTAGLQELHAQELAHTRQLRRIYLALVQKEPDVERYEALLTTNDPDTFIQDEVDTLMESPEFRTHLLEWAHEYMPFSNINGGRVWRATKAINISRCGSDTLHAGAVAILEAPNSDAPEICDDPMAPERTEMPWWDPSQPVKVIGVAANDAGRVEDEDCGVVILSDYWMRPPAQGCGCGPHLVYCTRGDLGLPYEQSYPKSYGDNELYHPRSQRRAVLEEPAQLFAHIIINGRPFSDLILGQYTMANLGLYHMYVRQARQTGVHTNMDERRWFDQFTDDSTWQEVPITEMNPHLLDDPDYTYDPRVDGELLGIPAAGVLTMIGPNAAWPRPRVRAARWLESLACDEFAPPELPIEFPPYQRDPATEGVCLHCHTRLDPAAISFKRIIRRGGAIAGVGTWDLANLVSYDADRKRFVNSLLPDTVLTPLSQQEVDADINNRLIDFMPPEQKLLGQASDGTIGPRGFAKILLDSGKFDECAVRRAYTRFGGRSVDLGRDADELNAAVETFVANGRDMNALIRDLVLARDQGW